VRSVRSIAAATAISLSIFLLRRKIPDAEHFAASVLLLIAPTMFAARWRDNVYRCYFVVLRVVRESGEAMRTRGALYTARPNAYAGDIPAAAKADEARQPPQISSRTEQRAISRPCSSLRARWRCSNRPRKAGDEAAVAHRQKTTPRLAFENRLRHVTHPSRYFHAVSI